MSTSSEGGGGILAMLMGDTAYGYLLMEGSYVGGGWLDLSWMLAQAMVAAAALHPTVAELASPAGGEQPAGSSRGRLVGLCGAALVGPEGNSLVVAATGGARYSAQPADIVFDASGRPGAGVVIGIVGLDSALDIHVEAETGYVH